MIPQEPAVGIFIKGGDPDSVHVRLSVLGDDVHRHLCKIEVGSDSGRRGDSGGRQHVTDHPHGKVMR